MGATAAAGFSGKKLLYITMQFDEVQILSYIFKQQQQKKY